MAASESPVLSEKRDGVLLLTLNRPDRLNAWTPEMMRMLFDAVGTANDDDDIGAVVVTGAGRGFCAGADVDAVFSGNESGDTSGGGDESADWVALCRSSKPLIAAVNGVALGVGLTMVLPFDAVVAADDARLSVRFVKMGLTPELASSHFLVARCGFGAASWLALSGEMIPADEAARLRLVDRVVPAADLLDTALDMARTLGDNPGFAVRRIKELLSANGTDPDLASVQRRETAALTECYASADHHEAVRAFLSRSR